MMAIRPSTGNLNLCFPARYVDFLSQHPPPKKTFNFPAKMEIHSISPFQIFHRPGLGIELSTCLDDTYWSTLDAKAGRLRPDHFLRTFPLTRSGKTRDGPMEMKMFKMRCPEIAELV